MTDARWRGDPMGWEAEGKEEPSRRSGTLRVDPPRRASEDRDFDLRAWADAIDLVRWGPHGRPTEFRFQTAPPWHELHDMGLTARQAAEVRGVNVRTAYGWAQRKGKKWKPGTWRR